MHHLYLDENIEYKNYDMTHYYADVPNRDSTVFTNMVAWRDVICRVESPDIL